MGGGGGAFIGRGRLLGVLRYSKSSLFANDFNVMCNICRLDPIIVNNPMAGVKLSSVSFSKNSDVSLFQIFNKILSVPRNKLKCSFMNLRYQPVL